MEQGKQPAIFAISWNQTWRKQVDWTLLWLVRILSATKNNFSKSVSQLEYRQSQEGSRRALCKFAETMLKLYKSRSKFTVKVTCLNSMVPLERHGHKEHICQIWTPSLFMPNMNTQSLTVRKLWPMFRSRSKVTVNVSHLKFMTIGKTLS